MRALVILAAAALAALPVRTAAQATMNIPADFPTFGVPGHEADMTSLRQLYWLHYSGAGPKATLWDEWLPSPSLWPAVDAGGSAEAFRAQWRDVLSSRIIDGDGYVATHQHASITHPLGWPFPFWNQGVNGFGWHFSFKDTIGPPWRPNDLSTTEGWQLDGARAVRVGDAGWELEITGANALLTAPPRKIDTFEAPFLQVRWQSGDLGTARPYVEWTTLEDPTFGPDRRVYFEPPRGAAFNHTLVTMYRHPKWKGWIERLRICLGNPASSGRLTLQAFFTHHDTRHNINGQNFVRGCAHVFRWTGDLSFLRRNINRMRTAIRYLMTEHDALKRKVVHTTWVGHNGLSGIRFDAKGAKQMAPGHGIGNNYWDLLPFGNLDAYATVQYYDALLQMAEIEQAIAEHPGWDVPGGILALDSAVLRRHAADVKAVGNRMFWNSDTGRFVACIDVDGKTHDYGFTFLNLEAIYYGFATPAHARSIMAWMTGDRVVQGDTSQGADIYHWRFGPRATTRRNVEWYFWGWTSPEAIPWGGQVQDGGAVLGFAFHDLMARLAVKGPDDAWRRLRETLAWFRETQAAGGYRSYYNGSREGTMQGGGTAGGLGIDQEFFESVMVPQVVIAGFLGFAPTATGFRIAPRLPSDWPELTVDRIRLRELTLTVRASADRIVVDGTGTAAEPLTVALPPGKWRVTPAGEPTREATGAVRVTWARGGSLTLERAR